MEDLLCPYCGKIPLLVDSKEIYHGRSYGMIWLCRPCNAYVGTHKDSKDHKPLGRLANAELRKWKVITHDVFDKIWQKILDEKKYSKHIARNYAYKWLSEKMYLDLSDCHIGMFDVPQCKKVVEICSSTKPGEINVNN